MSVKLTGLAIFVLTLWSCWALSPQSAVNWQVTTRMALALSIVDRGTVEISHFDKETGDKATYDGHVYADKTPGHPFLAVPVIAAAKLVRGMLGESTDADDTGVFFAYTRLATDCVNGLFTALGAVAIFLATLRLGATRPAAIFASFATALATPYFGWSTAFFAHSLTGSLLVICFALIVWLFPPADGENPVNAWGTLLLGLLIGYCGVVDLTAVPACAILGVFALVGALRTGRLPGTMVLLAIGGVVGLLPLGFYNQIAFGSPFHLGYSDTEFTGMQQGFFGVTWPNPAVLVEILFGFFRGLLPLSPVLLLVPVGLVALFRRPGGRVAAIAITLVVLAYLWINSSYFYWNGGWSTGPRHLVAMLPLAGIAFAFAWPERKGARVAVLVLLGISLMLSLACALAGMYAPDTIPNELTGWVLKRIVHPSVSIFGVFVVPAWLLFALLLSRADRDARTGSTDGRPPAAA